MFLEAARRFASSGGIQIQKRGATRPPRSREAMALVTGALGTLDRHTGVWTMNVDVDGKPLALALIREARFEEDAAGHTTLSPVTEIERELP